MDSVWFDSYMDGVPHTIDPSRETSLVSMFEAAVLRYPDALAVSNLNTKISYTELDRLSKNFANYLCYELKLKRDSRVAIMMPNLIQSPVAILGVLRAGMTVVNVNPLYTPRELIHQMNDAGVDLLLVLENFSYVVQKSQKHMHVKHIMVTALGDAFPTMKRHIVNFVVRKIKRMVPSYDLGDVINFREAMALGSTHSFRDVGVTLDDVAFLQYTGGTTGIAKGAELTHRNLVANVMQIVNWVKPIAKEGSETMIVALPLYHIFSLTVCFFSFMHFGSHCLLVTNPRDMSSFIKILSKEKFTFFAGLNTLFNTLINHKNIQNVDFSNLKLTVSGGMALQAAVAENWHKLTGLPIIEGYGLTEASPVVTINPVNATKFSHSIGLPIPSTEVKIIDDEGRELGLDQDGELCARGPQVMRGYWQRQEETDEVIDKDGWLKTGDIARIDSKGFVYIVDRKKDMIVVSGFNVYPNEVENVIASMPGIDQVAVIGVPCEKTNEAVKAFIVRSDKNITQAQVVAYCREHLTGYKVPKKMEFRFDLPVSNVGKVLRRELRDKP